MAAVLILAAGGAALLRAQDGGGVSRGVVTSAATSTPIPGATVRALLATAKASPVTTTANEDGAFELRGLPPGQWRISATRPGFVLREFGQRGRASQGSTIDLKDRAEVTADIALLRSGAIAGRVFDQFGDPAVKIRVQVMRFTRVENGRRLVPAGAADTTDDTGAFRVYDLPPGEYFVSARPPTTRERGPVRIAGEGTGAVLNPTVTFQSLPRQSAPTYFPGTPAIEGAAVITLDAGADQTGVHFALSSVATVQVSGTVVNSSGEIAPNWVPVLLNSDSIDSDTVIVLMAPVNNGVFSIPDVPPGTYSVLVRLNGPNGQPESAEVPLTVGTEHVANLKIATTPAVSLTGTVIFDTGARLSTEGLMLAATAVGNRFRAASDPITSGAVIDGAFQLRDLMGPYRLSVQRQPAGWSVKSIEIDGQDVTDEPVTFTSGRPHATVLLTNRVTDLGGTVTHDRTPVDADVLIFPDDPAKWSAWRFIRSLRADAQGMFSVTGMPPHDNYLALATTYLEPDDVLNPEFLALVRARATPFSLGEGQTRRLRLTLVDRSELDGR